MPNGLSSELLADVALHISIPGTEPVFTYRVPASLRALVRRGQLVWAPLRRQQLQGVVLDVYMPTERAQNTYNPDAVRELADIGDPEAALTPGQIALARWVSNYYRAALWDVLSVMLPPGVTQHAEPTWRASALGVAVDLGTLPEAERAVLYFLRTQGETAEPDLRRALRGSDAELRAIYTALRERGLVIRGAALSRARARPRVERLVRLRMAPDALDQALADLARAPKQVAALQFLHDAAAERRNDSEHNDTTSLIYPVSDVYAATGATLSVLQALERKGFVELTTREVRRDPLAGDNIPPDVPPPLSAAQERAWRPIADALSASSELQVLSSELEKAQLKTQDSKLKTILLHGVTGSGKTELYLRAIARVLRRGQQALVLVPEIALTAQLVRRFAARFPGQLAVLHSGLSLGERYDEWRRLRSGEAKLAIGSRSAVFAPLPNLGLIIVDEEHETSYKHDATPRYHARDAALKLAELTGSVIILGSATPSVESYAAAQDGRMQLVRLGERVGMGRDIRGLPQPRALPMPSVQLVDMRAELQKGNRSIFSRPLQRVMSRALERNEQVILFLNRRGAAAAMVCRDCGNAVTCPNCATSLAVHYEEDERRTTNDEHEQAVASSSVIGPSSILVCHTCNYRAYVPSFCPECWSPRIKSFGVGTQRVVEELATLYPEARALRWDRDSVGRKGAHSRMLDVFLNHEADVLVGTQMIAKGLDLPLVSVVGVIAADISLNLPDFRSGERTFQLLTQVAGRAGRRTAHAQVVIQTYDPEHYALQAAQEHDYEAFFTEEIAFRRQTGYPPFGRLVRFVYSSGSDERSQRAAEALAEDISTLAAALDIPDWSLIGPAPAFFHRQRNRFRWHMVFRAPYPTPLLDVLRVPHGWTVDVDPVNVL
ncbi:MAG TPA: primosomal protein N' [Roseiflexaceae bacterium]|nr:primosomal protein N' [Roseiflexaceae bacterium]